MRVTKPFVLLLTLYFRSNACRRCNSWGSPTSSATIGSPVDHGSLTNLDCATNATGDDAGTNCGGGGDLDFFGPQTRNSLGLGQHQRRRSQAIASSSTATRTSGRTASLGERSPASPPPMMTTTCSSAGRPAKQRSCSCSSQTDLSIGSSENLATAVGASLAPSLPNLLQSLPLGRLARFSWCL